MPGTVIRITRRFGPATKIVHAWRTQLLARPQLQYVGTPLVFYSPLLRSLLYHQLTNSTAAKHRHTFTSVREREGREREKEGERGEIGGEREGEREREREIFTNTHTYASFLVHISLTPLFQPDEVSPTINQASTST